jgi:hypothetical protein
VFSVRVWTGVDQRFVLIEESGLGSLGVLGVDVEVGLSGVGCLGGLELA